MGKWVPDKNAAAQARVSRLLAEQKAAAERKAAREEREATAHAAPTRTAARIRRYAAVVGREVPTTVPAL